MKIGKYEALNTNKDIIEEYKKIYPRLRHVRVLEGILLKDKENFVGILQYDNKTRYITALEVNIKYRGQGIGTDLLKYAQSKGIDKLSVNKSNKSAIKLYEKEGYRTIREDDNMLYMRYQK